MTIQRVVYLYQQTPPRAQAHRSKELVQNCVRTGQWVFDAVVALVGPEILIRVAGFGQQRGLESLDSLAR